MAGVSIRVDGADVAAEALRRSAERAANPRDVWDAIGAMLVVSTQQRFEAERDPQGNPWPPSIRVLTEGGRTLRDSGRLLASITYEPHPDGVEVGSNAIQAAVHQFGATIHAKTDAGLVFKVGDHFVRKDSVTIPQRAFLGVDRDDEAEITALWEDWLGEPLGEVLHAR